MAANWHGLDAVIPLGRLMAERSAAVAELVSQEERELTEMRCQRLASVDGVRPQNRNLVACNVLPLCFPAEFRKLVIGDAVLTAKANLDVIRYQAQIGGASIRHTWQSSRMEFKPPQLELESIANSRRIWTRELLRMPPCELGRQSLLDKRAMPEDRYVREDPCFQPRTEFEPGAALPPRFGSELLPTAAAVHSQHMRMPEDGDRAPQMIRPRVKVRFEVPVLKY